MGQETPHGSGKKRGKFPHGKRRRREQHPFQKKEKQWKVEAQEVEDLKSKYSQINTASLQKFTDFPLSKKTQEVFIAIIFSVPERSIIPHLTKTTDVVDKFYAQNGLEMHKYESPTDIQRQSIGLALQGHDVLGAAKTGSGKTLAFLIPILECLNRLKWSSHDGLGALIISPTRELAFQTFEVLRKVGKKHDFSAGLVIGGKHVRDEAERINNTNIVICTPGRLLQHMDETVNFSAHSLQILVLDEADRILDLGFQQSMNAIIDNLPTERQTLLYSATQTKSVKDLARLSLKDPMYVSVHENAKHSTPAKLQQSYIVCELHEKLDVLWSFLKHHPKSKIIVFMMCCKQVRYLHEAFCRLRPGISILALHGAMKQMKRVGVYEQFCRKQQAVLFATDIAARGLDFPAVNWVVQLDCPEDSNTYIHRAGRTARYEQDGEALLILLPSEEETMLEHLKTKKIPINQIKVNPKRLTTIQGKLESNLAADVTLKENAQRAFVSYLRSVFLMKDKKVFDINSLDTDLYARSLGLAISPRIRFLEKQEKQKKLSKKAGEDGNKIKESEMKKQLDNDSESEASESDADSEGEESESETKEGSAKIRTKQKAAGNSSEDEEHSDSDSSSDEDGAKRAGNREPQFDFSVGESELDDIFTVKKKAKEDDEDEEDEDDVPEIQPKKSDSSKTLNKFALAKKLKKKNLQVNQKVMFDDEGEVVEDIPRKQRVAMDTEEDAGGINLAVAKKRMQEEDKFDKQLYRDKIKKKHREERYKQKASRRAEEEAKKRDSDDEPVACLASGGEDEEDDTYSGPPGGSQGSDRSSDESQESDSGSDSEEEESVPTKRRKVGSDKTLDTGLSLDDDEAIALRLLQS